jgi:hypothetical protein
MFRPVLAALLVLAALPTAAGAAAPRSKAILEDHRHNTGGHDWHVQLEVNKNATRLTTVVVYSQLCGDTGFTQSVRLAPDGSFDLTDVPLASKKGTWSVHGSFTDPDHATGTWSLTRGKCTSTGPFKAQDATGHFLIGNPYEYAPAAINGPSLAARRLRKLKYDTRQNATRFDTIAKARRQGYELSTALGCPGMHHARKHGTAMWGKLLDATAPQSLVFWCDSSSHWTLAAFMYRASAQHLQQAGPVAQARAAGSVDDAHLARARSRPGLRDVCPVPGVRDGRHVHLRALHRRRPRGQPVLGQRTAGPDRRVPAVRRRGLGDASANAVAPAQRLRSKF